MFKKIRSVFGRSASFSNKTNTLTCACHMILSSVFKIPYIINFGILTFGLPPYIFHVDEIPCFLTYMIGHRT